MQYCLNSIRKIVIRVTSLKGYQNVRSDLTILGPFTNVKSTLCVSWVGLVVSDRIFKFSSRKSNFSLYDLDMQRARNI